MASNIEHFYNTIGGGDMYGYTDSPAMSPPINTGSSGNNNMDIFIILLVCLCYMGTISCISSIILPQMNR